LERLNAPNPFEDQAEPVWDLLPGAGQLQAEMTGMVQAAVRREAQEE
jgi:hypothetical protein